MNTEHKHIIHKIIAYFKGTMPPKEQHNLEKNAAADPFLQDAMEGLNRLAPDELEKDLQLLNQRLTARTTQKKSRKLWPYLRVAAVVLAIMGIGSLIFYTLHPIKKELALQQHDEATEQANIPAPIEQQVHDLQTKKLGLEKNTIKESENMSEPAPKKRMEITPAKAKSHTDVEMEKPPSATASAKKTMEPIVILEDDMELLAEEDIELEKTQVQPVPMEVEPIEEEAAVFATNPTQPDERVISGTVFSADDELPLPGVSVIVENTNQGTITGIDGRFRLKNPKDSIITFAFIGMEEQKVNVNQTMDTGISINMQQSMLALEEVVVVKYDKKKQPRKRNENVTMKTASSQLQGQVAGVSTQHQDNYQHITSIKYPQTTDKKAQPKGGFKKLDKYLARNIKGTSLLGTTQEIKIEIARDGSLSRFYNLNYTQEAVFEKIKQLLKEGPKWQPAEQNNANIKSEIVLILTF